MSQNPVPSRKSSKCCIGCGILAAVAIVIFGALGYYGWTFFKENIALVQVGDKVDPSLNTPPSVLLPQEVGNFTRTAITDNFDSVPNMADMKTSGVSVGQYIDPVKNNITVIALHTADARHQKENNWGPLVFGRGKANSSEVGFSIRDPYSGKEPRTIVTWSKPRWTFMVQTSSTLAQQFVKDFQPGTIDTPTSASEDTVTSAPAQN